MTCFLFLHCWHYPKHFQRSYARERHCCRCNARQVRFDKRRDWHGDNCPEYDKRWTTTNWKDVA